MIEAERKVVEISFTGCKDRPLEHNIPDRPGLTLGTCPAAARR